MPLDAPPIPILHLLGPALIARTLSRPRVQDRLGGHWQYHPRSDDHSKIACWAILFDLMVSCAKLRERVERAEVAFGINHTMSDFQTRRSKDLDLVICSPGTEVRKRANSTFAELAEKYKIPLLPAERRILADLPRLVRAPVGSVQIALEAKACMTAHIKALPRLFDELNSSQQTIHASADVAIAVGFSMVNMAVDFTSPTSQKDPKHPVVARHRQPGDGVRTVNKLAEIKRRSKMGQEGFDAFGILCVKMHNDGSPVDVWTDPPAPAPGDVLHYDSMVRRLQQCYESRF